MRLGRTPAADEQATKSVVHSAAGVLPISAVRQSTEPLDAAA